MVSKHADGDRGSEREMPSPRRFGWKSGVGFYLAVQATSFGLGLLAKRAKGLSQPTPGDAVIGNEAYNDYYNSLRQPVFAPPDWAFAPVWTLNNALQIWGLLHVLNQDRDTPGRTAFLALQGGFWATFVSFNPLYFGLRSPILGAAVTQAGLALTLAIAAVAAYPMKDRRALASLGTLIPWLLLAAPTAAAIARWNRDDFFNAGPFADPPPGWIKGETWAAAEEAGLSIAAGNADRAPGSPEESASAA